MRLLALALLPACDVVFGIAAVPPLIEVNHGDVTIDYTWTVATQTAGGPMIATKVAAPSNYLDLRAQLLDGTVLPVAKSSPTQFTFTLPPGATYVVRFQARDASTATEIESSAATMNLVDYVLDRQTAVGATQPLPITYYASYSSPVGVTSFAYLASLGARAQAGFDVVDPAVPHLEDWRAAVTAENVAGPLLSTGQFGDHLVLERWATDGVTQQWLTDALIDDVEMVDGQPLVRGTPGAPIAVPAIALDHCAELDAQRMTVVQRLEDMTGWTDTPSTGWGIYSTLSYDTPPTSLLALAGNLDATADQLRDVHYGKPFPGEVEIALIGANATEQLAVGTAAPATLYAGVQLMAAVPPSTASSCAPVSFTSPGLAIGATIAGQPLAMAGQTVTITRSQRVPFEVTIGDGPWDDVRVALLEVYDDNGVTNFRRQMSYHVSSDPPAASIDPTLLVEGHYYLLQFNTRVGFPTSRQLDLSVVQFPFANTTSYSKLFKIASN